MVAPTRRTAARIHWESPQGQSCELAPLTGGLLEVELHATYVSVHSRNCSLLEGDDETPLAEYEFCVPLGRCMIEWSRLELTTESQIERSAYFQQ